MRPCSRRIIFKIMLSDRRKRMLLQQAHPGHSRIAIAVGKIHVPLEKYRVDIPRERRQPEPEDQYRKNPCSENLNETAEKYGWTQHIVDGISLNPNILWKKPEIIRKFIASPPSLDSLNRHGDKPRKPTSESDARRTKS